MARNHRRVHRNLLLRHAPVFRAPGIKTLLEESNFPMTPHVRLLVVIGIVNDDIDNVKYDIDNQTSDLLQALNHPKDSIAVVQVFSALTAGLAMITLTNAFWKVMYIIGLIHLEAKQSFRPVDFRRMVRPPSGRQSPSLFFIFFEKGLCSYRC